MAHSIGISSSSSGRRSLSAKLAPATARRGRERSREVLRWRWLSISAVCLRAKRQHSSGASNGCSCPPGAGRDLTRPEPGSRVAAATDQLLLPSSSLCSSGARLTFHFASCPELARRASVRMRTPSVRPASASCCEFWCSAN